MVLIRHIEGYLTKIGIDMGMDEQTKYSITVNNGQVNLASDSAILIATQNNSANAKELNELIEKIRKEIPPGLSTDDLQTIEGSLEIIKNELEQLVPRHKFLQTALSALTTIKGTAEFAATVIALTQFVQSLNRWCCLLIQIKRQGSSNMKLIPFNASPHLLTATLILIGGVCISPLNPLFVAR